MSPSEPNPSTFRNILISDRAGVVALGPHFESVGLTFSNVWPEGRNWQKRVLKQTRKKALNLVLVPTAKFDASALLVISEICDLGVNVVVWGSAQVPMRNRQWILEKLLEQKGAIVCLDPAVVAAVCRLLSQRDRILAQGVRVRGAKSSIHERILAALENAQVSCEEKGFSLIVDPKLGIRTEDIKQPLGSPLMVANALARLIESAPSQLDDSCEIIRNKQPLDLILEPPRRVLSEVVSKKILAAFGMGFPAEQLCQSPSEAARFAASINGPVVLKLVKPQLEGKQDKGAVICGIEGRAAVRRAAQQLEGLNAMLGPPPALGLLAAEQVDGTFGIWIEMVDDPDFGRLVRGGVGHHPGTPLYIFKAPATLEEVIRSTKSLFQRLSSDSAVSLCRGISVFSQIVDFLGDRIERAEIHPMVVDKDHREVVVLDALFAIAD